MHILVTNLKVSKFSVTNLLKEINWTENENCKLGTWHLKR